MEDKQQIAITRALVHKPAFLFLDDASSALEDSNEEIVQEALDRAQKGCTSRYHSSTGNHPVR